MRFPGWSDPPGTGDYVMHLEGFVPVPALAVPQCRIVDLDASALEVNAAILADVLVPPEHGRLDPRPQYPPHQICRSVGVGQLRGPGDVEFRRPGRSVRICLSAALVEDHASQIIRELESGR